MLCQVKNLCTPKIIYYSKLVETLSCRTWQSQKGLVGQAVEIAIRAGYRSIDCAYIYRNEDEIGAALKKLMTEGIVRREDLFITSKLW